MTIAGTNGTIPVETTTAQLQAALSELDKAFKRITDTSPRSTFKEQLKEDTTNTAYRIVARQLMTLTSNLLLNQMRKHGEEDGKVQMIASILATDFGEAILQMILGGALSQLSYTNKSPKLARLLKEFRIAGMTTIGNEIVENIIQSLLPVLNEAFSDKEDAEKEAEELLAQDLQRRI